MQIALAHAHLTGGGYDLPVVRPVFEEYIASFGFSAPAIEIHPGSFFTDPLPAADVLLMGHILHDWDLEQKRMLLHKAYDALPAGGAVIVFDAIIDDDRKRERVRIADEPQYADENPRRLRLHRRRLPRLDAQGQGSAQVPTSSIWPGRIRWSSG